jgi:hypothetical protein
MAYSQIEQKYLDTLAMAAFPEAVDAPMDEPSLDGVQLAAGPSKTRTDAPAGAGLPKAPTTPEQAAEMMRNMPLATQSEMIMRRIAEDQKAGVVGSVIPKDMTLREKLAAGMQQMLIDNAGMDNARARRLAQTMFGGDSSGAPLGIGLIDVTPFVIPLATQEAGIAAGEAMESAEAGKYGQAALQYGTGVLQSLDAVPGVALAAKGAKKVGEALAPAAADVIEGGMRKSGMIMDIAPAGPRVDSIDKFPVGPGSIKPTVIAPDAPLYREMSADNLTDFLRQDNQFSYAAVFVADNADLALGQGSNKGIKVQFRANAVSGEEHRKPMTGDLAGREYKANVFAPKAIESITFDSEADLKKLKGLPAKVLQTEFERASDGKKNIVFIRKAQLPAVDVADDSLTKTGAILKPTPDSPGIEVKSAPKLNTPAFKNWFGDSKVVDDKDQPLVMYHGTLYDNFEQFSRSRSGAHFFSPDPKFASEYAKLPGKGIVQGGNVIPVYIKASNPFDYENATQRKAVIEKVLELHGKKRPDGELAILIPEKPTFSDPNKSGFNAMNLDSTLAGKDSGNWALIETKEIQDAIKSLGFDSFYAKELGVKNLGVYDPTQIKSVFNKGTFDPKDPRFVYGGGAAAAATAGEEKK